ncbi:MAG: hypothetical protein ABI299_00080 [Rhodanobacter sp.]
MNLTDWRINAVVCRRIGGLNGLRRTTRLEFRGRRIATDRQRWPFGEIAEDGGIGLMGQAYAKFPSLPVPAFGLKQGPDG